MSHEVQDQRAADGNRVVVARHPLARARGSGCATPAEGERPPGGPGKMRLAPRLVGR